MASRIFARDVQALTKSLTFLEGSCVLSSAGVVSSVKGDGIKSITKLSGAGQFKIVLDDGYPRLLMSSWGMVSQDGGAAGSGIAAVEVMEDLASPHLQADVKSGVGYTVQMFDFAGAAANPANACVFSFMIVLSNSNLPQKGN